ncbi:MAG: acetolactate synthase small subunit [Microbacteriaceae bacterium]|jgi:acetolactate synthase-1/3 small subunit|nr:acetolactate synthase small subunit [Microbacteriaceae bacterium]MCI1207360.1 acetolactate synthase small subunit [Microbacteriaceae bacterium]
MSIHILSMLVENRPGLLTRVSGLFARRGFNIESMTAGPSEVPNLFRMTLVADVESQPLEQVTKQLNKLVDVVKIVELKPETSVLREHLLIKVKADPTVRQQVVELAQLFRARVVDVASEAVVVEATGEGTKLNALLDLLEPYGVKEIVHSGLIAIARGNR